MGARDATPLHIRQASVTTCALLPCVDASACRNVPRCGGFMSMWKTRSTNAFRRYGKQEKDLSWGKEARVTLHAMHAVITAAGLAIGATIVKRPILQNHWLSLPRSVTIGLPRVRSPSDMCLKAERRATGVWGMEEKANASVNARRGIFPLVRGKWPDTRLSNSPLLRLRSRRSWTDCQTEPRIGIATRSLQTRGTALQVPGIITSASERRINTATETEDRVTGVVIHDILL
ncbi:hypothetical protein C8R45DRAFT_958112 [Mycena sanguinolenta]|nr:hypothetical protein C8R45DRAFT_958112 [Mycena sanguinolenta]